jgi:glycosyltransferase involved in cell wall biosynthesis
MKVLQLIDTLHSGGAERMAVSYANALVPLIEKSYLCSTRFEGVLKDDLVHKVEYFHLKKKSILDIRAFLRLRKFIKNNNINIIHAHGASFFLAGIIKLTGIKYKLIWHNHYGASVKLSLLRTAIISLFSYLFDGIIVVNTDLKIWAKNKLQCGAIKEIKNFVAPSFNITQDGIILKGNKNDFRIICVANFRPEKDHINLIKAFQFFAEYENVSLHLVGGQSNKKYSNIVKQLAINSPASGRIFFYGSVKEIFKLLKQAHIGVIPSKSEGLPVALLEYGIAGLSVVTTDVGNCKEVLSGHGLVVPSGKPYELFMALFSYYSNPLKRLNDAALFEKVVLENYSEASVIKQVSDFYNKI